MAHGRLLGHSGETNELWRRAPPRFVAISPSLDGNPRLFSQFVAIAVCRCCCCWLILLLFLCSRAIAVHFFPNAFRKERSRSRNLLVWLEMFPCGIASIFASVCSIVRRMFGGTKCATCESLTVIFGGFSER